MRLRPLSAALGFSAAGVALALTGALLWLQLGPTSAPTASAAQVPVLVGDNWFCTSSPGCDTKIDVGDKVIWNFNNLSIYSFHTTTANGGPWDSGIRSSGTFSWTFDQPGTYAYMCTVHGPLMSGTIIVNGDPTATPVTPSPTPVTPSPTPTSTPDPSVGGIVELPEVAGTPLEATRSSGTNARVLASVAAVVAATIALALGGAWYARRRWAR